MNAQLNNEVLTARQELMNAQHQVKKMQEKVAGAESLVKYFGAEKQPVLNQAKTDLNQAESALKEKQRAYDGVAKQLEGARKAEILNQLKQDYLASGMPLSSLTDEKLERLYQKYQDEQIASLSGETARHFQSVFTRGIFNG